MGSVFFPFAARDRRRRLHRERAVFFYPFAARDRRRKLHLALPTRFCHRICDRVVQNATVALI
jgi:hypothetical protein